MKGFSVYPDKADVNLFFTTVKQGDEELTDTMRQDMAQKYYMEASNKPEMKVDLFKSNVPAEEVDKIQRVNIFKTKETDNQPSVILCMPTVNGEKLKPREISPSQWQRMWLAENMQDYKKHLAASLFADVLRKDRTDAVAVGTEKTEQEAQSNEVKQNTAQQEEDKATEEQKEETPEKKEQKQKEEKAKEEKTKAETKAAVVAMTPMLKQFYELKGKHPDAVLLFRCGDFYETYCQDAEKASKILGITLTKSSHTKDADGKPLAMAGFPYHALDTYLPKLIRAGERVAICDQLEAPKRATRGNFSLQGRESSAGTEQFIRNTQITCNHHVKESRICRTICRVCHGADAPIWHTCFCYPCTRYLRECKRTERVVPKGKQSFRHQGYFRLGSERRQVPRIYRRPSQREVLSIRFCWRLI